MGIMKEVITLYPSNFRDIAKTLRVIADQVEDGTLESVSEMVVILGGDKLDVFSLGISGVNSTLVLLELAKHRHAQKMLELMYGDD